MRNKEVAVVSTTEDDFSLTAHLETPRIDVSMHLPSYPGLLSPLFGRRILFAKTEEIDSPRIPVDFLFRAHNFQESLHIGDLLQSIVSPRLRCREQLLEDQYPAQIVLVVLTAGRHHHPAQPDHTTARVSGNQKSAFLREPIVPRSHHKQQACLVLGVCPFFTNPFIDGSMNV
jgi:hypothetical protein